MNSTRLALLLNPPGQNTYIRDYYCSKLSRTGYTFPPIDLLHAGAVFNAHGWTTRAIDAIVQGLGVEETLELIERDRPDVVYVLVGAVSVDEDGEFLRRLRTRLPEGTLIGSGDVLREHGVKWVETGLLDAVSLDFCSASAVQFAEGETDNLTDLIHKTDTGVAVAGVSAGKNMAVGLPPHELFASFPYRYPFAHHRRFASLLTDYGCPYRCSFCVMASLRYHIRPMDEITRELEHLKALGIREFALWDQTFAVSRSRAMEFLRVLPGGKERFSWTCFTRPDCIEAELAAEMAAKGCHTVIMGVETAKAQSLEAIQKDVQTQDMKKAFSLCRKAGLETAATVIVGLPGESVADIEETMDFVCDLDPDYLSVHTAIPRAGTGLRRKMVEDGLVSEELANMDQSGEMSVVSSDTLDPETILALRKRFNRRFYLRPKYLLRTLLNNLKYPGRLFEHTKHGLTLLMRNRG